MAKDRGIQVVGNNVSYRGSGDPADYCANYDSVFEDGQDNPESPLFLKYDAYAKREQLGPYQSPSTIEALTLADINLKTRGLVGVVLGSLAKYLLFQPPSIKNLQGHRDLDVLVLNPHSSRDPMKNEWGVDWWVRPDGEPPTNSRVNLWYDIGLREGVEVATDGDDHGMESPFSLDEDKIIYTPKEQEERILRPGLHLLDEDTLKKIVSFCNKRAKEIREKGLELAVKWDVLLQRVIVITDVFTNDKISVWDIGDLIISEIQRFREKYRIQYYGRGIDGYQGVKESLVENYGYYAPDKFLEFLRNEVSGFSQALSEMPVNYRYLIKHSVRQKRRPVFPVIPSGSIDFKEMDNNFIERFKNRFAFGTDFHGNLDNIDQFLEIAKERKVDHVIFGGDIAPKRMAIRFSDGKEVSFDEIADSEDVNGHDSEDLYRRGYMLFDENMSSIEFSMLCVIFKKLSNRSADQRSQSNILEWEEILLLEKHKDIIAGFLREKGQRLIEFHLQKGSDLSYGEGFSDPKKLADALIDFLKHEYFTSRQLLGSNVCKVFLTEDERKRMADTYFHLQMTGVDAILLGIGRSGGVLGKWQSLNDELHLHSDEGRKVFFDDFIKRIREFKKDFNGTISIILGNDDPKEYIDYLKEAQREGLIVDCTNAIVSLGKDIEIIGYSNVSPMTVAHDYWFKDEVDIRGELEGLAARRTKGKILVANIHCPPVDTRLSLGMKDGSIGDFGSEAVRKFVNASKPNVLLCGHVHESWRISKVIRQRIGDTLVFNPGASERNCRILVGNFEKPEKFELEIGSIDGIT